VYPGTSADFALYDDDGVSYEYEKDRGKLTHLHWDDVKGQLTSTGAALRPSLAELVKIIR
jgi:alpha-D-xyloside xylohydrolase